jgi:hypothetical protein
MADRQLPDQRCVVNPPDPQTAWPMLRLPETEDNCGGFPIARPTGFASATDPPMLRG